MDAARLSVATIGSLPGVWRPHLRVFLGCHHTEYSVFRADLPSDLFCRALCEGRPDRGNRWLALGFLPQFDSQHIRKHVGRVSWSVACGNDSVGDIGARQIGARARLVFVWFAMGHRTSYEYDPHFLASFPVRVADISAAQATPGSGRPLKFSEKLLRVPSVGSR